jgi:hypothetical protein
MQISFKLYIIWKQKLHRPEEENFPFPTIPISISSHVLITRNICINYDIKNVAIMHKGIIGIPIKILLLPASSFRDRELL